jgi:hypothetical protein
VYCFFFICVVCLYVFVWSVETDPFVEFTAIEDLEGFEQQHAWVEGKSLMHSFRPITTCVLITLHFTFCLH